MAVLGVDYFAVTSMMRPPAAPDLCSPLGGGGLEGPRGETSADYHEFLSLSFSISLGLISLITFASVV